MQSGIGSEINILLLHLSHLHAEVIYILNLALPSLEGIVLEQKFFELVRCIEVSLLGLDA